MQTILFSLGRLWRLILVMSVTGIVASGLTWWWWTSAQVGWVECVNFPDIDGVSRSAKFDTGAKTSSLGAQAWRIVAGPNEKILEFEMADRPGVVHRALLLRMAKVRSSMGQVQERPVIALRAAWGAQVRTIHVNLADRATMRYPVLLGRTALKGVLVLPDDKYRLEPREKCPLTKIP
jgi:hypothetical protein